MKHTIESSKDKSRFISNIEQRPHLESHIQDLKASMKEFGYIPSQPVAVIRQGAKLLIIDGHSRFDAATQLGIEFCYIILDPKFAEAVQILNIQKAWTSYDCARRFAIRGEPDYKTLLKYVQKGIPLVSAASMLYGQSAGSGNAMRRIKDGRFEVRDTDQIDLVASFLEELSETCPAVKSANFMNALSMCYLVPEFDGKRLRAKIATNPRSLTKTTTRDEMLLQIEEIFNFKATIKIPLAFKAKGIARERQRANPQEHAAKLAAR